MPDPKKTKEQIEQEQKNLKLKREQKNTAVKIFNQIIDLIADIKQYDHTFDNILVILLKTIFENRIWQENIPKKNNDEQPITQYKFKDNHLIGVNIIENELGDLEGELTFDETKMYINHAINGIDKTEYPSIYAIDTLINYLKFPEENVTYIKDKKDEIRFKEKHLSKNEKCESSKVKFKLLNYPNKILELDSARIFTYLLDFQRDEINDISVKYLLTDVLTDLFKNYISSNQNDMYSQMWDFLKYKNNEICLKLKDRYSTLRVLDALSKLIDEKLGDNLNYSEDEAFHDYNLILDVIKQSKQFDTKEEKKIAAKMNNWAIQLIETKDLREIVDVARQNNKKKYERFEDINIIDTSSKPNNKEKHEFIDRNRLDEIIDTTATRKDEK